MTLDNYSNLASSGQDRVLDLLKLRGPQTTAGLARALKVSSEAVRQQLARLAADGHVARSARSAGVGRPSGIWGLTSSAQSRFPDAHAQLTVRLIEAVRSELGTDALDRIVLAREREDRESYSAELRGAGNLGEKVARLAAIRAREGYMAEWRGEGEGFLLIENHCPICAAAAACQGFCRAELEVFQDTLGPDVTVERTDHILAGARRCAYRIAAKVPEGGRDGLD